MATFTQLFNGIADAVNLLQKPWLALGAGGSADVAVLEAAAQASTTLDSDLQTQRIGGVAGQRAFYAAAVATLAAATASLVASSLRQLARTFDLLASVTINSDPLTLIPLLYTYMSNNGFRVMSRLFVRGVFVPGRADGSSNVGNGTVLRLLVDRYGFALESGSAQVVTFACVADANSGTNPGQEQFTLNGQPLRDPIARYTAGSGSATNAGITQGSPLVGIAANNSQANGINNPSFSSGSLDGSGNLTLSGWTITGAVPNQLAIDTVNYYRASSIEGATPASLRVNSGPAITLTQNFRNNGQSLDQLAAYFAQLAINRQIGGGTADVTVTIGSLSWAFTYTVEAGWRLLRPTIDKGIYFPNFNQETLNVSITVHVTSGAGTWVNIDDLLFSPWSQFDGVFYAIVGGSLNFLFDDGGTVTDSGTTSTVGIIQQWFAFTYGLALPSVPPPPQNFQMAAFTPSQGAGAGAVTPGNHAFKVSFVRAQGSESPLNTTFVVGVVAFGGAFSGDFAAIPLGPSGTVARGIYATKAGGGSFFLVGYINDNVTVNAVGFFNVLDAALTVPAPTPTVIADPA